MISDSVSDNIYNLNMVILILMNLCSFVSNWSIGVAPITQLRCCVINIITFKGSHLLW